MKEHVKILLSSQLHILSLITVCCFILNQNFSSSSTLGRHISVYLPRIKTAVIAEKITVDNNVVVVSGDLILGDISYKQLDDGAVEEQFEPKGHFAVEEVDGRKLELLMGTDSSRWPNSLIYYQIAEDFTDVMVDAIHTAAWVWTHNSPMRFIESSTASDRIKVTALGDLHCMAYQGRKGGIQSVAMEATGSCNLGRIIHEFGHSIGWNHEHLRPDRDQYIRVNEANIVFGAETAYEMVFNHQYGAHRYDYGSVMHYPRAGLYGHKNVISVIGSEFEKYTDSYPNELPTGEIGQRFFLSTLDKQMSYTYLAGCFNDEHASADGDSEPKWVTAQWGGCNPQCDGASFRQRLVSCRKNGVCKDESRCNSEHKPATRQSCELAPGNLNVTFDEENWWEVGSMMQNVMMYDQYEWNVWHGSPPKLDDSGQRMTGDRISDGPGGDASETGDGRYLWFSSWTPLIEGDQAWYESPVLGTTNAESCEVSFDYFIVGKSGKLQLEIVSCDDCWDRMIIWDTTHRDSSWTRVKVTVPSIEEYQVRLRFVGVRQSSRYEHIGIDNIQFSEGCIRADLEEVEASLKVDDPANTMPFPFELDPYCTYINTPGFSLSAFHILLITFGAVLFISSLCGVAELILRKHRLKKKMYGQGFLNRSLSDQIRAATTLRQMNPKKLSAIIHQESCKRFASVRDLAATANESSFWLEPSRSSEGTSTKTRVKYHRNKSKMRLINSNQMLSPRFNKSYTHIEEFADESGLMSRLKEIGMSLNLNAKGFVDEKRNNGTVHEMTPTDLGDYSPTLEGFRTKQKTKDSELRDPSVTRDSEVIYTKERMVTWLEEDIEDEKMPTNLSP